VKKPGNVFLPFFTLPFLLFLFLHHQQQTPRQFIDRIFAAGFKTAIRKPLARKAE
jgi:hypothetical protein